MVSKDGLAQFKALYLKEFGEKLSKKQAIEKANRVLRLYYAVYGNGLDISKKKDYGKKIQPTKNIK